MCVHEHLIRDVEDGETRYRCQGCGDLFAELGVLREALVRAEMAMQSAQYELQPGHVQIGGQFIKKEDMEDELKIVRHALAATPLRQRPPAAPKETK